MKDTLSSRQAYLARSQVRMQRMLIGGVALGTLIGAAVMFGFTKALPEVFNTQREAINKQVVTSITRDQQVVLLSAGIQGLVSEETKVKVLGITVPGSSRILYMQYGYKAKLGIDGRQVKLEKRGPAAYKITVPEFIFIGHSNEEFKVAVEKNGVLSWVSPEVDHTKMINQILSDDAREKLIADNREMLQEQAVAFYAGIIKNIEPQATVEVEFTKA